MCSHRISFLWAMLAVLCTLVVFFCPASQGPFTAVHGPMTALRAWQSAGTVLSSIAAIGAVVFSLPISELLAAVSPVFMQSDVRPPLPIVNCSVLRC
jgi:hypothetical protein